MSDLHTILDRTTDRIETPDLAASALAGARVVRRRRIAVVSASAAIVAGVAVVFGVSGSERADPPIAPPSEVPAVQPVFDPRQADSLAFRDAGLPETMNPPADVPSLPMDEPAALVLRGEGANLFLLTADGRWATTQTPSGARYYASLSPDGTRLASVGEMDGRLFVTDVQDGAWREIPVPDGMRGLFVGTINWLTTEELVIWSGGEAWTVPLDGGEPRGERRMPTVGFGAYTLAPDGLEISFGWDRPTTDSPTRARIVAETRDGTVLRTFTTDALGNILGAFADEDQVVAMEETTGDVTTTTERDGIVVLDRDDYTPTHLLPLKGLHSVSPLGWLDDGTVLFIWSNSASTGSTWVLVAWELESGELTRVTTGTSEATLDPLAGITSSLWN